MWIYKGAGESIPGVPMADMTDEEFSGVEEVYDAQHDAEQRGSLRTCGLYEHVSEPAKRGARAAEAPAARPGEQSEEG